jgi:uncharacterized protein
MLQSTPFCNIDCDYCYLPNRRSTRRMAPELAERVAKSVFESSLMGNKLRILWHAGEPLATPISFYEDVCRRIDKLNNKRYEVTHTIQSNGMLITQEWCDFFKTWDVGLGISIDGPAFIHDRRRKSHTQKGTHAQTMRGVSMLRSNDINFGVLAVITQFSLNFPDEIVNFFLANDIRNIGFNHEEVVADNLHTTLNRENSEIRLQQFLDRVYQLAKESGRLSVREFEAAEEAIRNNLQLEKLRDPFVIISMDTDGNLTTFGPEFLEQKSPLYGDFSLGNIESCSVEEMRLNPRFQKVMTDVKAGIELCRQQCEYFDYCGGGNPTHKYYENGTFISTETLHCKFHIMMPINTILKAHGV